MGQTKLSYKSGLLRPLSNTMQMATAKEIFKQKPSIGDKVLILKDISTIPNYTLQKLSY